VSARLARGLLAPWLLAFLATGAAAEPLYVIEQLVVNVNSAADGSGQRVATLKSGDRVEAIEKSGDEVHVRLPGGQDGWLRASYLSAEEPLRVRLTERDAQLSELKAQLATAQEQLNRAARPASAPAPAAAAPASLVPEETVSAPMFSGAAAAPGARGWPWTVAAALSGFGIGFALGALLLDRHIRRKYGGLRIY
jgi:hypothetical protein